MVVADRNRRTSSVSVVCLGPELASSAVPSSAAEMALEETKGPRSAEGSQASFIPTDRLTDLSDEQLLAGGATSGLQFSNKR